MRIVGYVPTRTKRITVFANLGKLGKTTSVIKQINPSNWRKLLRSVKLSLNRGSHGNNVPLGTRGEIRLQRSPQQIYRVRTEVKFILVTVNNFSERITNWRRPTTFPSNYRYPNKVVKLVIVSISVFLI